MATSPDLQTADFDLRIQPMAHVASLPESIAFYEALGGTLVFGSRDGDWALMRFGGSFLSLLAHEPSAEDMPVELQFVSGQPLERIEEHLKAIAPAMIAREIGDEAFGRMLKLRTPDGLVVKLLELERDLIA